MYYSVKSFNSIFNNKLQRSKTIMFKLNLLQGKWTINFEKYSINNFECWTTDKSTV